MKPKRKSRWQRKKLKMRNKSQKRWFGNNASKLACVIRLPRSEWLLLNVRKKRNA